MKILIFATLSVFCTGSFQATAQVKHPFLFFSKHRIADAMHRVQSDTLSAHIWDDLKNKADHSLNDMRGGNLELLSLAWCMTGDDKYADAAKRNLMQVISRTQWDGMDDRTPKWNSGLNTAHTCFSAAVAYDGIYDHLSNAERKQIAEGIVRMGINPLIKDWISTDERIHSLNSMGHNWWSACVFMAGVASLAVRNEIPEADAWSKNIMEVSREWFAFSGSVLDNKPSNFDPAGGFYESISYADFALSEYLYFRLSYQNVFGSMKMPYDDLLEKSADWFIHGCYPTTERMMSLNFGDSNPHASGIKSTRLMLALGFNQPRYFWYLQQVDKILPRERREESSPVGFVLEPGGSASAIVPDLALSSIYENMGWATLRSSWNSNETLLGVKCGYTWNHAHADAGSFVLYHRGRNLLIDGGDVSYGLPEYSSYFVRSEAHNVVLMNGKAQDPQDQYHAVKNTGHLYHLMDGDYIKYVMADATGPTSRYFLRNYRNFLWIGNVILIIDDLKTYDAGKIEWLLHFEKDARKIGPDLEIRYDSAAVLVRPLFPETLPTGYPHDFPEKMKLEERTGIKDRDAKTKITYYAISPAEPSRQEKLMTAIVLLDEHNQAVETFTGSSGASGGSGRSNLPTIEKIEGDEMIGVKIIQGGKVTYVYLNMTADGRLMHRNSINTIEGWETDAYLFAVTFPEKADHTDPDMATNLFVGNGSFLRRDKKVIFHSLSSVFLNADRKDNHLKVVMQGQPVIRAQLRMESKPRQVLLNNKNVTPDYRKETKTVVLEY